MYSAVCTRCRLRPPGKKGARGPCSFDPNYEMCSPCRRALRRTKRAPRPRRMTYVTGTCSWPGCEKYIGPATSRTPKHVLGLCSGHRHDVRMRDRLTWYVANPPAAWLAPTDEPTCELCRGCRPRRRDGVQWRYCTECLRSLMGGSYPNEAASASQG